MSAVTIAKERERERSSDGLDGRRRERRFGLWAEERGNGATGSSTAIERLPSSQRKKDDQKRNGLFRRRSLVVVAAASLSLLMGTGGGSSSSSFLSHRRERSSSFPISDKHPLLPRGNAFSFFLFFLFFRSRSSIAVFPHFSRPARNHKRRERRERADGRGLRPGKRNFFSLHPSIDRSSIFLLSSLFRYLVISGSRVQIQCIPLAPSSAAREKDFFVPFFSFRPVPALPVWPVKASLHSLYLGPTSLAPSPSQSSPSRPPVLCRTPDFHLYLSPAEAEAEAPPPPLSTPAGSPSQWMDLRMSGMSGKRRALKCLQQLCSSRRKS